MPSEFRLCACGCGQRVKQHRCRWATPQCVPAAIRAAGARKSRRAWAYKRRAAGFRADLAQLEQNITREDLLEVMNRVYRRAYLAGYRQGQTREVDGLQRAQERGAA